MDDYDEYLQEELENERLNKLTNDLLKHGDIDDESDWEPDEPVDLTGLGDDD